MSPVRSQETKDSFAAYLAAHPSQRFWQALRNWSGYPTIIAEDFDYKRHDTFYWEENGPSGKPHLIYPDVSDLEEGTG